MVAVRLPRVTVSPEGEAHASAERPLSLPLRSRPTAQSFAIVEGYVGCCCLLLSRDHGTCVSSESGGRRYRYLLVDPTREEESLASSRFTLTVQQDTGDLLSVYQPGGAPVALDVVRECLETVRRHAAASRS